MPTPLPARAPLAAAACLALSAAAGPALAQHTIDFEDLPVGTLVAGQYRGVVFSTVGASCGGAPPIGMTIQSPPGGAFSGARALGIQTGCPDFSPDGLRMNFIHPQRTVSFALRAASGTAFSIRSYDSSGILLTGPALTFNIAPAGTLGAYRLVTVSSPQRNVRRIEVQSAVSDYEIIDYLTYDADLTPPEVDIAYPTVGACLGVGGLLDVFGRVCDPDGEYVGDTLDFRPVGALEGTPWTTLDSLSGSLCKGGELYTGVGFPPGVTGDVFLRLTGRNADGLQSSATTIVHIDAVPPDIDLRFPAPNQVVRGAVCFDGTVSDRCEANYAVSYRPGAAGSFLPVQPSIPQYVGPVINDPLIPAPYWNTAPLPDGPYQVRIVADDTASNSATVVRTIIVDNTPPTVLISAPQPCRFLCGSVPIIGTVTDPNLDSWTLQYTGGGTQGWVTIASGTSQIASGTLGVWNTDGLPRCAYTLRLVATDRAQPGCGRGGGNSAEHTVSVNLGPAGDFNRDLIVNSADLTAFIQAWLRGVAGGCE